MTTVLVLVAILFTGCSLFETERSRYSSGNGTGTVSLCANVSCTSGEICNESTGICVSNTGLCENVACQNSSQACDQTTGLCETISNNNNSSSNVTLDTPTLKSGKVIGDLVTFQGTTTNLYAGVALQAPTGVYKYEIKVISSSNTAYSCQMATTVNGASCGTNVGNTIKVSWRGMNQTGNVFSAWSSEYTLNAPQASLATPALRPGVIVTIDDNNPTAPYLVSLGLMSGVININAGNYLTQPSGVLKYEFKFTNDASAVITCSGTVNVVIVNGIQCGSLNLTELPLNIQWRGCNSDSSTCSNWSTPFYWQ